jgi:hypothetical protein
VTKVQRYILGAILLLAGIGMFAAGQVYKISPLTNVGCVIAPIGAGLLGIQIPALMGALGLQEK